MNNVIGGFEELVEKGQSGVHSVQKSASKGASNFAKTASTQVSPQSQPSDQGTNEGANSAAQNQQKMSDDDAKKFLRDLYGVSDKNQSQAQVQSNVPPVAPAKTQTNVKTALGLGGTSVKAPSTAETIKTAIGIPQSPQEKKPPPDQNPVATALGSIPKDPHQGLSPEEIAKLEALRQQLHKDYYESLTKSKKPEEEHVTEKLEREEKEEKMEALEEQKKKPPPIAVQKVQQSAEKFRGVSG